MSLTFIAHLKKERCIWRKDKIESFVDISLNLWYILMQEKKISTKAKGDEKCV
jgi:hypothetical protein